MTGEIVRRADALIFALDAQRRLLRRGGLSPYAAAIVRTLILGYKIRLSDLGYSECVEDRCERWERDDQLPASGVCSLCAESADYCPKCGNPMIDASVGVGPNVVERWWCRLCDDPDPEPDDWPKAAELAAELTETNR